MIGEEFKADELDELLLPNVHPGRISLPLVPSAQSLSAAHNLARRKTFDIMLLAGVDGLNSVGRPRLRFVA